MTTSGTTLRATIKDRIYNSYVKEFDSDVKIVDLCDSIGYIVTDTNVKFRCSITKNDRVKKNSWRVWA